MNFPVAIPRRANEKVENHDQNKTSDNPEPRPLVEKRTGHLNEKLAGSAGALRQRKIMNPRKIKIEERGDFYRKRTVPTVRLKGKWLQAAGLAPGQYVTVTVVSPGVIELRLCGQPEPDGHYQIAALRLDKAIEADKERGGK